MKPVFEMIISIKKIADLVGIVRFCPVENLLRPQRS